MAICEVLRAGPMTTIQDWPGAWVWKVGVPPSGPMDDLSFRLANMASATPPTRPDSRRHSWVRHCDSTSRWWWR